MPFFDNLPPDPDAAPLPLAPGAVLLRGLALIEAAALLQAIEAVLQQAPLRHMVTPGGFTMSVAMSNCGALGWVSDPTGYRYTALDTISGQPWPQMPACCLDLAQRAAAQAGYANFQPDACLRCFCLAHPAAKTGRSVTGWCMATWWCGVAHRGWLFMVWRHWPSANTRCWAGGAST